MNPLDGIGLIAWESSRGEAERIGGKNAEWEPEMEELETGPPWRVGERGPMPM